MKYVVYNISAEEAIKKAASHLLDNNPLLALNELHLYLEGVHAQEQVNNALEHFMKELENG